MPRRLRRATTWPSSRPSPAAKLFHFPEAFYNFRASLTIVAYRPYVEWPYAGPVIFLDFNLLPIASALFLGILASIAPCALTSNIAAIAYVNERLSSPLRTVLAGAAYTAGRVATYAIAGSAIFIFGTTILERFEDFQVIDNLAMGFFFIVVGAMILDVIKPDLSFGYTLRGRFIDRFPGGGIAGAFGLGAVFSLAFCPYVGGLFFGVLMPLALNSGDLGLGLPLVFGLGTGLPVLAFATLVALGVRGAPAYLERLRAIEPHVRKLFGAGLLLYGFYLVLALIM